MQTAKATKIVLPSAVPTINIPKKEVVTAYARVSTLSTEQAESQERQEAYYTEYIKRRSDWTYRDIYADPGLSGTRAEKRPNFMRMIEDCRQGLINRILVKSLSRFARNTVDALTYIRMLKEWRVSVFFESENIDTMTPGGEVLITILAGLAEQESRNISKNVIWALNKKFASGEIIMQTKNFLGFTKDKDGEIVIDTNEAQIVQRIFREFIGGYSAAQIAGRLKADGIKSPFKREEWAITTILSIIRNPKYCGDAIMGKTYKPDVVSAKRLKNDGVIRDLFYIPDCVPQIIPKEIFNLAKAEDERRSNLRSASKTGSGRFSNKFVFSGMLTCASCGSKLRRWANGYQEGVKKTYYWICINKQTFRECKEKPVDETWIEKAFVKVLNSLIGSGGGFIATLRENIRSEVGDSILQEIEQLDEQIAGLQAEVLKHSKDNRQGLIGNTEYDDLIAENEQQQITLTLEKNAKILKSEGMRLKEYRLDEIERILIETVQSDLFDSQIFKELVETVTMTREKITFYFKCGIELSYDFKEARVA